MHTVRYFPTLPPEIWGYIVSEYGLFNKTHIKTIKMIPNRHCIMETVYTIYNFYMDYMSNLCYSINSFYIKRPYLNNNFINKPHIFNKKNLFDIINYFSDNITIDNLPTININEYKGVCINLNNKIIKIQEVYETLESAGNCIGYYMDNKHHRIDGPAIISWYNNGNKQQEGYYIQGELHRIDGPAIMKWYNKLGSVGTGQSGSFGTSYKQHEYYYVNNKLYRLDGPAKISWYKNGSSKRTDQSPRTGNIKKETYTSHVNNLISREWFLNSIKKESYCINNQWHYIEWYTNGNKKEETYYMDNKPYRTDGPAITFWHKNGNKSYEKYYTDTGRHRIGGPAHTQWDINGCKIEEIYYMNNKLHRYDGPAIIRWDDTDNFSVIYYKNGIYIHH